MTQVLDGERISGQGKIRLGCSAAIFDEPGRILLTRRVEVLFEMNICITLIYSNRI